MRNIALVACWLGVGLVACSSDDLITNGEPDGATDATAADHSTVDAPCSFCDVNVVDAFGGGDAAVDSSLPDGSDDASEAAVDASEDASDAAIKDAPDDVLDSAIDSGSDAATKCTSNAECSATDYCEKGNGNCKGSGVCTVRPTTCNFLFAPQCGCDKMSYTNSCKAHAAGESVDYAGFCE